MMILDLPPQIEQQIVHTAKRRGITAESLITQLVQQDADKPSYAKGDFNFDLERMQQAINSGRIEVPSSALTDIDAFDKWLDETIA